MRVYAKIVLDMASGRVLEAEGCDYAGPVALCKGGGGGSTTTNTQDTAYNARMATIAEQQQAMSQEAFDFWRSDYKPLEQAEIQANLDMISQAKPVREKYIQESLDGVNEDTLVATARADAEQSATTAAQSATRNLARLGINPDSGAFADALGRSSELNRARLGTLASNTARTQARQENFNRLAAAAGLGLS
jgi:hypothetical protein